MKTTILFALLFFTKFISAQEQTEYTREREFERLTLTNADLKKIINSIIYYHKENLRDTSSKFPRFSVSCELRTKNSSKTINDFQQLLNANFDGETYTELSFSYRFPYKSVSSISIKLRHYSRALSVSGPDKMKVDALFRDLEEQIANRESIFWFVNWDLILNGAFFILFMFSLFILINSRPIFRVNGINGKFDWVRMISGLVVLIGIIYFVSPLRSRDILPDFEFTENYMPWYDRYSNLISICFTLIGVGWNVYVYIRKNVRFSAQRPIESGTVTTSSENQN